VLVEEALEDRREPAAVLGSDVVYEGRVWAVRRDRFAYGDGSITREYVDHPGAVAILAVDDDDRVLLIRQYRHPIRCRDWELPAGLLDVHGEDPLQAARRELAEEADLAAARWSLLADFFTSPGGSSESVQVYLARDLSVAPEEFHRMDEEADIEKRWVTLDEAVRGVLERRLRNSILSIAVLALHAASREPHAEG